MKKRKTYIFLFLFFLPWGICNSNNSIVVSINNDKITFCNQYVERTIQIQNGVTTTSIINKTNKKEYSSPVSNEFDIMIDGKSYTGQDFHFIEAQEKDINGGKQLDLYIKSNKPDIQSIDVILSYFIYDDTPVIRKQFSLVNNADKEVEITNLNMESIHLIPDPVAFPNVYANYGTNITRIPYIGDYYDPAILLYNEVTREGVVLGNESPGILKRTDCYSKDLKISIGMKRINDDYPFKTYIQPKEMFTAPRTFLLISNQDKWENVFDVDLANFVSKNLGVKLFKRSSYPLFYYCTWNPFRFDINEKLIEQLADNLEGTGIDVFIIDDGWQDNYGDYNSHPQRFPNGIEKTCEYIRSKGMKPGMWFSITLVNQHSKIYQEHPEWAVTASDGSPANVYCYDPSRISMSMSTSWYDYIFNRFCYYIESCKLGYIKLDFAVSTSAYITDKEVSGDYTPREGKYGYKDQASSYWSNYQSTIRLFDALSRKYPDLIIDCTFEAWGKFHLIDYSLIQHADVDWLTNYEFDAPLGPISIRQINAERGKVIPIQTMMVGNQPIDSPMKEFTYQSLASGVQLMCGDPRNLSFQEKKWYAEWSSWFKQMDQKYQYSRFYYRSDVFDYPTLTNWDGTYRFNPEKGGGILFFYRNASLNETQTFPVPVVLKEKKYSIYEPCGGKKWGIYSGEELLKNGLKITISKQNESKVLGIEEAN